jgi:hypothetical protein
VDKRACLGSKERLIPSPKKIADKVNVTQNVECHQTEHSTANRSGLGDCLELLTSENLMNWGSRRASVLAIRWPITPFDDAEDFMKRAIFVAAAAMAVVLVSKIPASGRGEGEAAPIYGVKLPPGYRDWKLISATHEEVDFNQLRAQAYREGKLPFPDGAKLSSRCIGSASRRRKTTKSLDANRLSSPDPLSICRSWSRTQKSTPRRAAGGSETLGTANLATRRYAKNASRATYQPKLATMSTPVTLPDQFPIQWLLGWEFLAWPQMRMCSRRAWREST